MSSGYPMTIGEHVLEEIGFNNPPEISQVDELFADIEYERTTIEREGWEGEFLRRSVERALGHEGTFNISDVRTWFDREGEITQRRSLIFTRQPDSSEFEEVVAGFTINE